jgi:hypothetical protein
VPILNARSRQVFHSTEGHEATLHEPTENAPGQLGERTRLKPSVKETVGNRPRYAGEQGALEQIEHPTAKMISASILGQRPYFAEEPGAPGHAQRQRGAPAERMERRREPVESAALERSDPALARQ